ncbi:Zn finger family DNA binding protein [Amanita muscaria]
MMPQVLPHPSNLALPKYIPDYPSNHFLSRPRLASVSSLFPSRPSRPSPDQLDSPSDIVEDDRPPSPSSRPDSSGNFQYVNRVRGSLLAQVPPRDMYENNSQNPSFISSSQSYQPPSQSSLNSNVRGSETVGAYLSSTPSPVDARSPMSFPHSHGAPPSQDRFPHSGGPYIGGDRLNAPPDPITDRYSRADKYSTGNSSLVDQRRMSEPAILGSANLYSMPPTDPNLRYSQYDFAFMPANVRSSSNYVPSLQRVSSFESREGRPESYEYSGSWRPSLTSHRSLDSLHSNSSGIDQPISPIRPSFSSALVNSPVHESHYGPSPPNTGNSTTSNAPYNIGHNNPSSSQSHMADIEQGPDSANRTYSFVALPGNAVKKRPRRRYDEIERLYHCSWPNCAKAYGTLNHLNAHVTMQKHGSKRSPSEFKELRKQWRKAKKESDGSHLVGPPTRRGDNTRFNDPSMFDPARFGLNTQPQSRHSSLVHPGMPSGSQSSPDERYTLSSGELRYPVDQRDEQLGGYLGDVNARPRYGENVQSSWHPSPPRSETHYPYPSSVSSQHHAQVAQISVQTQPQPPPSLTSPRVASSRLPPNSTLLTPLPGYQTHTMLPPLQTGAESNYDAYDNDSTGRPGTGHASIGPGSGDEYERRG